MMPDLAPIVCRGCSREEPGALELPAGWAAAGPVNGGWERIRYGYCAACLEARGVVAPTLIDRGADV